MASPSLPPQPLNPWKRLAIIGLSAGAGFALVLALGFGVWLWYSSRPKPPKLWYSTSIVAKESPEFSASEGGKNIDFIYTLENTTTSDYQITSADSVKIVLRREDGVLSPPCPGNDCRLGLPVFVPASQSAFIHLFIAPPDIPTKAKADSEDGYHERLRTYLDGKLNIAGFAMFDDLHHYQINLPKWASKEPASN